MSKLNPILAGSAQSIDAYQQAIAQTSQAVAQWLQQPEMYQGKSVDELRERITLDFNEQGLGNQAAIERAIEYFLKDSLSVHHPQCVAHLHCPSLVVSQAAEVLINATNQSMDSWDQSPSATIIEIKLIEWLRAQVGYGAGDAGVFTSGGTQSNMMGLMLARDAFFARRGHSIQQDGLPGDIRQYKVLCSENAHFSVQKNMALMGLGYRSVTLVKTDEFARMDVADLKAKIAEAQANGEQIMAIVATAGTGGYLAEQGLEVELVKKVLEGRPNIVDAMKNGEVHLVFNTTSGKQSLQDSFSLRRTALMMKIPYYTTTAGALAAAQAIGAIKAGDLDVKAIQDYG